MSPGFSPLRMRSATSDAATPPSSMECIGPPTVVFSPKKLSRYEKIGGVRRGGKASQAGVGFVGDTCSIDVHQVPEDRAVRWEVGSVLQDILERQPVVEFE